MRRPAPAPAFPAFPLLLAVLLGAGAGCVGDGPAEPPAAGAPPQSEGPGHVTFTARGTTVAAFRSNPTVFADSFPRIWFNVTSNVTALLVELAWDDPVQDLDAFANAAAPSCPESDTADRAACEADATLDGYSFSEVRNRGGGPGAPDSPSRVLATREVLAPILDLCGDPCPFGSYPRTHQMGPVSANVAWENHVTLFYGPVPEGFTAIPDAAATP